MKRRNSAEWFEQLVFVGPAFVCFALIMIIPFILGMYYSFTSWNGVSDKVTFNGIENFRQILFHDLDFMKAFWFTIRFSICAVIIANVVAFTIAFILTRPLKLRNSLRTVFFLPNVIGGLLLGFIWQFIFVKGFPAIGQLTHIPLFNLPWLGDETTSFWALVIVFTWQTAGYFMVIYIAALMNVPRDVLEAARIDGASSVQLLRTVIVPLIMPAVTVCLFLAISNSFKMFDLNLSLTKGGPFKSTESVALNIYTEAFQNNRFGLGTAKALIFFIVVALITSFQVKLTKSKEVEA
jgi:raffinose/stachyose/melibiose transport system permease protein